MHILYTHLYTWYEKRLHLCKRIMHICTHDIKKVIFLWGKCLCTLINTFVHMIWEKVFFLWGMSIFMHILYTHFYAWYAKRSSFYEVYNCALIMLICTHDIKRSSVYGVSLHPFIFIEEAKKFYQTWLDNFTWSNNQKYNAILEK